MTSIVWDGYVFAADRRSTHSLTNGLVSKEVYEDDVRKIIVPKEEVLFEGSRVQAISFAGDVTLGRVMEAAVLEGRDLKEFIKFAAAGKLYREGDFVEMLIVCEDCVWSVVPTATAAQMVKFARNTVLVRGTATYAVLATMSFSLSSPYGVMAAYLRSSNISSAIDYACVPSGMPVSGIEITTVDFKSEAEALGRLHRLVAWKHFLDRSITNVDDQMGRFTFLPVDADDILVDLASWNGDTGHRVKLDTIDALIGSGTSREKLMHALSGGLFPDPDLPIKGRRGGRKPAG